MLKPPTGRKLFPNRRNQCVAAGHLHSPVRPPPGRRSPPTARRKAVLHSPFAVQMLPSSPQSKGSLSPSPLPETSKKGADNWKTPARPGRIPDGNTKKEPGGTNSLGPFRVRLCGTMCPFCVGRRQEAQPFTMEAISSAKFSCFFSMPSPFSKRTASLKAILPPRDLAEVSIYLATSMELSFTNSCWSRQFSL